MSCSNNGEDVVTCRLCTAPKCTALGKAESDTPSDLITLLALSAENRQLKEALEDAYENLGYRVWPQELQQPMFKLWKRVGTVLGKIEG